ncbi:MAG: hypothetical protein WC675_03220 [Patescibacteria group bacterium]|jgi:farnesol kinase
MFREEKRQGIHVLLFLFAFLLKYLSRFQAVGILFLLLFFTLFLVPKLRIKSHLYRQFEKKYSEGAILYFLTLLVLVLVFPPSIVAAAWAILALGDGMATLVGKNFRAKELAWNQNKTYAGSLAFVFFGTIGAMILLKWMIIDLSLMAAFSLAFKTAIVAAIVESLPIKINDNITVTVTSALVLSLLI